MAAIIDPVSRRQAVGVVAGVLVVGVGGLALGRYVVPTSTANSASTTTTTVLSTTTTTQAATTSTSPGQMLPIAVQPTNDGVSGAATVLMPSACILSGSAVTATGNTSFVPAGYRRVGDVVELYVYTAPISGYPEGVQLGYLSQENAPYIDSGSWSVTVPLDTSLGSPARCAVTVQATHQVEDAPSAY